MFEELFTYPAVIHRHLVGPLVQERIRYLEWLRQQGLARDTLRHRANGSLCVVRALKRWPQGYCFDEQEIEMLAEQWAIGQVQGGRSSSTKWAKSRFQFIALEFLQAIGRYEASHTNRPSPYESELRDFITFRYERRLCSPATCRNARWQVSQFLEFLSQRGVTLAKVCADDIDAYFHHKSLRWKRCSLHSAASRLRVWFRHCGERGWSRSSLDQAIVSVRIYRHEGLPLGPTWQSVGSMLQQTSGKDPQSLRDHAILLLFSVYGLRSGEVRHLRLEDLDWRNDRIHVIRSKSMREETWPLEPQVGSAIARYLRHGRPRSNHRCVFLRLRAPHTPLSPGGMYYVVERFHRQAGVSIRGRGPHGLRHACARHLLDSGRTLKEIGDHLGHASVDAVNYYTKVDLRSLRQVALEDLGGLL